MSSSFPTERIKKLDSTIHFYWISKEVRNYHITGFFHCIGYLQPQRMTMLHDILFTFHSLLRCEYFHWCCAVICISICVFFILTSMSLDISNISEEKKKDVSFSNTEGEMSGSGYILYKLPAWVHRDAWPDSTCLYTRLNLKRWLQHVRHENRVFMLMGVLTLGI